MNKKLMASLGFDAEIMKIELGYCPTCNKEIVIKDFINELSVKEYQISGLCQVCQDKAFGTKPKATGYDFSKLWTMGKSILKSIKQKLPTDPKWIRYESVKPGQFFYVMNDVPEYMSAEQVHVSSNEISGVRSNGYGGSVIKFECTDGNTYNVQGPWHSNSDYLFENTGIDLRDKHLTELVIGTHQAEGTDLFSIGLVLFQALFQGPFQIGNAYANQWYEKNKEKHPEVSFVCVSNGGVSKSHFPIHCDKELLSIDAKKYLLQVVEGNII